MKPIRLIFIILGAIILLNGIIVAFLSNFTLGIPATMAVGVVIILLTLFFEKINKILRGILILGLCLAVLASSFLLCFGFSDSTDFSEDAVIVLGAAVHGDTPSLVLKDRLDTAIYYHKKNPTALIVVSGGMGNGESVTEAEAMEKYLISHGVPLELIIKEEQATSTLENFKFSKAILNERLNNYTVAFVTNEYHVFRAGITAKQAGISDATHINSTTRLNYLLPGTLRECMAVARVLVFGFR